ncbi:uncharacterized protein LOC130928995 isoform X2 [Corythoichthys intestinalis]|nr:uncharacterized protein LOC130928995 isoform X2 [Corythoichthys intestinalis]
MSKCQLSQKCITQKPGKSRIQSLSAFAQPVPEGVSRKIWELIANMHQDEVAKVIKAEKSIIRLGEHLYCKLGHDKTKHKYIRQKMREMGRLLQHSRKDGKLNRIEDFYKPSNFNLVMKAVRETTGFDEDTNTYKIPSLARKLRHRLLKIADILQCEAQMEESDNEEFIENVKKTRVLYERWDACVSSCELQTLLELKWNTPEILPFTDDVQKIDMHLDNYSEQYQNNLQENPNTKIWSKLASNCREEVDELTVENDDASGSEREAENDLSFCTPVLGFLTTQSKRSTNDKSSDGFSPTGDLDRFWIWHLMEHSYTRKV